MIDLRLQYDKVILSLRQLRQVANSNQSCTNIKDKSITTEAKIKLVLINGSSYVRGTTKHETDIL